MGKLCKDCRYFYKEENGKISCFLTKFSNIEVSKALIFVPELFDCEDWDVDDKN